MIKALIGVFLGLGIAVLGVVLIAVPTTGWEGAAIGSGFQALEHLNVVQVFQNSEVGLTVKIGVALAVYVGPIITVLGLIAFLIQMFTPKKKK